jgi:hypothetical protein
MEQQQQGSGAANGPDGASGDSQDRPQADEAGGDSTWGVGSASAMDHLRRNDFRVRRSKRPEQGEHPHSE